MDKIKTKAIIAGVAALLVFVAIGVGLYLLGGNNQSALQKLRDIAIIFIVLGSIVTVILLAAITAALGFLALQIKDRVIPLLEELTGTAKRVRGTTNFVTEEAVKPLITVASTYSRLRSMTKTVKGTRKKPPKVPQPHASTAYEPGAEPIEPEPATVVVQERIVPHD
ncbi:MAG TPA: hypothetical protein VGR08_01310 [Thermomicrobiales bacterium]|nr:hypothetical protein [Thermomicrobiales bacterium]